MKFTGAAAPRSQSAMRLPRPFAAVTILLAASWFHSAEALIEELYTTNSVCRERYCINPIFPAMDELPKLEAMRWEKREIVNISKFMGFCGKFVNYDPSVPMVNTSEKALEAKKKELEKQLAMGLPVRNFQVDSIRDPVEDTVADMDRLAARRYFFHLAGMGIEGWEHEDPAEPSTLPQRACAKSVAKMVCYTFFPKANAGFPSGARTDYIRPCATSCQSYLQECGVDCCDESLECIWGGDSGRRARVTENAGGKTLFIQTGYYNNTMWGKSPNQEGPCEQCTGAAAALRVPVAALLALASGLLLA